MNVNRYNSWMWMKLKLLNEYKSWMWTNQLIQNIDINAECERFYLLIKILIVNVNGYYSWMWMNIYPEFCTISPTIGPHCFYHVNCVVVVQTSLHLHKKSKESCIKKVSHSVKSVNRRQRTSSRSFVVLFFYLVFNWSSTLYWKYNCGIYQPKTTCEDFEAEPEVEYDATGCFCWISIRAQLLEAWLALTQVKCHDNL